MYQPFRKVFGARSHSALRSAATKRSISSKQADFVGLGISERTPMYVNMHRQNRFHNFLAVNGARLPTRSSTNLAEGPSSTRRRTCGMCVTAPAARCHLVSLMELVG
eukprot:scaffold153_cov347-Pavlova_lutheri.AAC.5